MGSPLPTIPPGPCDTCVSSYFVRPLQALSGEAVLALQELLAQFREGCAAPVPGSVKEEAKGFDVSTILGHEACEAFKVVIWLVLVAASVTEQPLRLDSILDGRGDVEYPLGAWVAEKQFLE